MAGTINSLGIGSGVLTADVIDKLKANDEALQIKPLDSKIALSKQKTQALDLLSSLLNSFKSGVSALSDSGLYQKRSVSGSNDNVSVSAAAGSQIRDFSMEITNIAKKNVLQSGSFTASTDKIAKTDGKLNLNIGGTNYVIDYTAATSLDDLKQKINDTAGSAVSASILQTSSSAYNLVVTSKATGKEQTISLTDLTGQLKTDALVTKGTVTGSFLDPTDLVGKSGTSTGTLTINVGGVGYNFAYTGTTQLQGIVDNINADATLSTKVAASIVQYGTNDYRMVLTPKSQSQHDAITLTDTPAVPTNGLVDAITLNTVSKTGSTQVVQDGQDALFKFDGISMTRSTNTITDIASGLTINLLKDSGSANISITQDRDQIATELQGMVNGYNTLQKQLDDMTLTNKEAGTVGIFNGDNTIKNLGREISRIITAMDKNGHSLPQYGISLNRDGTMSFDKSAFMDKMETDPGGTEAFFSGKTTVNSAGVDTYIKGVFTTLNDQLKNYLSSTGLIGTLNTSSKAETTALTEQRTRTNALLTARYDTMMAKFAAYDSMISKINAQFSSLQQQIQMAINAKN